MQREKGLLAELKEKILTFDAGYDDVAVELVKNALCGIIKNTYQVSRVHAYFSRISAKEKKKFREQLALLDMGLEDRMKQPVGLLSGGQRQALTLLMATMVTPRILLLDEHTAALDPATADKVLALTEKIISDRHITCLMVTHNMHQALSLGNRTLMMDGGRIVFDVSGKAREKLTVDNLLEQFKIRAGKQLDNDRILLSK